MRKAEGESQGNNGWMDGVISGIDKRGLIEDAKDRKIWKSGIPFR